MRWIAQPWMKTAGSVGDRPERRKVDVEDREPM